MDDAFKAQLARAYADGQAELFRFLRGRLGCEADAAGAAHESFAQWINHDAQAPDGRRGDGWAALARAGDGSGLPALP